MKSTWFARRPPPRMQVLMVCMGNICRSPTAEAVLRRKLGAAGLGELVGVDSVGTHAMPRGTPADPRAVAHAARRGYDLSPLRTRALAAGDFERFDLLLAMDQANLADLREQCPPPLAPRLGLLMRYAAATDIDEVPDPYYGPPAGFEHALDLIEGACDGLLHELRRRLS
jgi:protein-tyrosine phosphatase